MCDAFESDTEDHYADKPSPEQLMDNVRGACPGLREHQIEIHATLSNDLDLEPDREFRFIHVDGGHSAQQAYFDLTLCSRYLAEGGVIAMDDYHHEKWPGVTEGTDRFLYERDDFRVLADLNRRGALGRKLTADARVE
ncbi:MAG: class I SAM-dependent methyltransferase [Gammaproteobacteria bacterium]|nr:class I SAM-dependent methyltransferase [Gammaproteobacteria bacterium]